MIYNSLCKKIVFVGVVSKISYFSVFIFLNFLFTPEAFAALSCSVSATCASPDVVVLRMASTANSHAELPSQSNYSQLVCCSGVSGLSNSCTGTFATVLRLSGTTNAHVEENTESTAAYNGNNACLSVSSGTVTLGYQNSNCSGFDTTVASISQTPTNAHVGDSSTYTRKVCASTSVSDTSSVGSGGGQNNIIIVTEKEKKQILAIADFNNDNKVNILDLSVLLYYYGKSGSSIDSYDLKKDGVIDFKDVSIMFYYWNLLL
ncbi:hypothetical protein A2W67_02765 [Candidatus Nomurabacteria bacterium RIFCSPLOWO2_02_40_28]|uniref:Dockerin domain-containing protein n=2 Tax=Candidatus Nomuraibacteriota TaxID=1752729 RepID=A0A837HTM2_9BACT|nr:MAG: hypothetical protein UT27_C0007G0062 [Candidatus Nomurabacteria bacterium GW2011_GWD2_39_12]KKR20406.1 MAG: hypothetical protein UT51_C0004G0065 [Candidatus Nomurabacteria bacterium GW2011_GWC2_39_41]KKR38266.1 MAG: hypothetical protein UT73_C0004G0011 [Candidatus Nomurabacteria bacterium GW2011_GWB1_40_11]KKR39848.1 MAG: hypothetical protein UT74_C0005G0065 [Parcubacteria group bacterium GW2011_GWC1_40_11]KKR67056.1 MAG: hypothetical protein UU07_C0001G0047 [Parcubacteria group bacteri